MINITPHNKKSVMLVTSLCMAAKLTCSQAAMAEDNNKPNDTPGIVFDTIESADLGGCVFRSDNSPAGPVRAWVAMWDEAKLTLPRSPFASADSRPDYFILKPGKVFFSIDKDSLFLKSDNANEALELVPAPNLGAEAQMQSIHNHQDDIMDLTGQISTLRTKCTLRLMELHQLVPVDQVHL